MKTRVECPHCKSKEVEYSGTIIKQRWNNVKEFYCLSCHEYFLWANNIKKNKENK